MSNRLPELLDHLVDAAFLHDVHGRFLDVNREACRSLQRSREEWLTLSIFDLDVRAIPEKVLAQLRSMREGDTLTTTSHHRRSDGADVPVEIRLTCAARDLASGEPRFLAIVHDISARVAAQKEIERLQARLQSLVAERTSQLQDSTRLFRAVLDHTHDAVFLKDRQGRYLLCNQAMCVFLGRSEQEILGRVDTELFGAEAGARIMAHDAEIMRRGAGEQLEESLRWRDREVIYLVNKNVHRNEHGEVVGLVGISQDITAMRRVEVEARENDARLHAELREAHSRLQLAMQAAHVGIWELDLLRGEMTADARMHALFGGAPTQQSAWRDMVHSNDLLRVEAAWDASLREPGRRFEEQFRITHFGTGEERTIRALAHFVHDDAGNALRVIGLNSDVTEQRRVHEELLAARESALGAERAKSSFLAAASHELRTPLNGIVGIAELLLDSGLSHRQRQAVELMKRSGDNLLVIVDDLLDSARIDAGTLRMRSIPFQLTRVLADAFALLGADADAKGLRLRGESWPGESEDMLGDPDRVLQIVTNLIRNAIKFTSHGTVTVAVRDVSDAMLVRIEVHDTGTGIPIDLRTQIFEPFVQAQDSGGSVGTGLGLWICRHLVQRMGGEIGVESREGHGSTFWIELPRQVDADAATRLSYVPQRELHGTPAVYRPLRLLLVEDNEPNRHVATLLLEHFGHAVVYAEHGQRALELLDDTHFDAILMDCEMPELDGYETTRRIRARERGADARTPVPILALTASGQPETRTRCLAAGMSGYALKPLRRDELSAAFRSIGLTLVNPQPSDLDSRATPTPPPVLDGGQVEQLREIARPDGSTLFELVAGLVLREMPDRMESLDRLLTAQEPRELAQLAHKIAGSSASIGAALLYQHAQALEHAARSEAWAEAGALVARSHAAWSEVRGELQKLLQ